jgi:gluconolactonase
MNALAVASIFVLSASDLISGSPMVVVSGYQFAEGPVWVAGEGLLFSDVRAGKTYRADGTVFRETSNLANGLAVDNEGRLIACESGLKRITRTEKDGAITVLADAYQGKALNSTNDVAVRSDGGIYFTDPGATSKTALSTNGVYRIDPKTLEVTELSTTARYPNGIGFSPDEKILYVADYMGGVIRQYDVADDGSVSNERVFCEVPNPDGFAVDERENLWTADRQGVSVYSREGQKLDSFMVTDMKRAKTTEGKKKNSKALEVPGKPTNCCFGGEDGKTLYITSRSCVFALQTNLRGAHLE